MFSIVKLYVCFALVISLISYAKQAKQCPDVPKLSILPGVGWDGLTTRDTKQLMQLTYNQCKLTNDGEYLIPDHMITVALKDDEKQKQLTAEIIEHWSSYTPPTANFTTWPNQYSSLRYSFAYLYQDMKALQVKYDAFTCRSQMRQVVYRINTTSDAIMDHSTKERFLKVIRALSRNNTEKATYLVEMIVSDYGTHFSKSVDVGAVFIHEDYLKNSFLKLYGSNRNKILSASKWSILEDRRFSWNNQQDLDLSLWPEYNRAKVDFGFRFFGRLKVIKNDVKTERLADIDKSGDLLTNLVTSSNFPNISSSLLMKTEQMLRDALQLYFAKNVHQGCTRPQSSNFDILANINTSSCTASSAASHYVFGGVYELCERVTFDKNNRILISNCPEGSGKTNSLTGAFSCPQDFESRILHSRYEADYLHFHLFSCIANSSFGTGYMFGGLYSFSVVNIHTKTRSCPQFYSGVTVLSETLTICVNVSNDESAKHYALPFGGFASCLTEFNCPVGYEKHLAVSYAYNTMSNIRSHSDNIYYCLQEANITNFGLVNLLNRPPFGNITSFDDEFGDDEYDEDGIREVPGSKQSYASKIKVDYFFLVISLQLLCVQFELT
uniref:MACPF domain-containing protein n=1 Tax=Strigamia maritima TaxID=126957 RepID=T1JAM5_STRMM